MPETQRRPVLRFDDGGWAEAIGGHVAIELVNTVAWRPDPARTVDRLPDGAALVRWAGFAGLVDDGQAARFTRELTEDVGLDQLVTAEVRRTREQLHRVLQPMATGASPAVGDVDRLHRRLVRVLGRAEVVSAMPLEWATGLRSVRDLPDELGLHAWRLLQEEDPRRVRQCLDGDCGWLFLDRTRNGSRVWCSSADCGNRTRARRHYRRHVQAAHACDGEVGTR